MMVSFLKALNLIDGTSRSWIKAALDWMDFVTLYYFFRLLHFCLDLLGRHQLGFLTPGHMVPQACLRCLRLFPCLWCSPPTVCRRSSGWTRVLCIIAGVIELLDPLPGLHPGHGGVVLPVVWRGCLPRHQ